MKFTKSMRRKFKEERDAAFEKMRAEEDLQEELRTKMEWASEEELKEVKVKYERSIAIWKQLKEHYEAYDTMASKRKFHVSPDTALVVGGSLVEIVLILYKEKSDIIASKAINYVLRKKV